MTPEKVREILYVHREQRFGYRMFCYFNTRCRRKTGTVSKLRTRCACGGIVHSGNTELRKALPEECRDDEYIIVYTRYRLTAGFAENETFYEEADQIELTCGGPLWRVVRIKKWDEFGFYAVLAVRMKKMSHD